MSNMNGYEIIGELKNNNSGFAKWGFARKNGANYFIKEFLSPVYPADETVLSKAQIDKKKAICTQFEYDKRVFYNELNECYTGNIVTICDFFRDGSKYYMVTEKINADSINPLEISRMSWQQKILILKVLAYSMSVLHDRRIVHSDIKADNILFKRAKRGFYTAKIIDFDSSFTEDNPPESDEDLQGDMVYFAPESFMFIAEEGGELTTKIDVFALGILFHQYLTGELPGYDKGKYDYIFESVLDGEPVTIDKSIPEYIGNVILRMLDKDPEKRPTCREVFNVLRSVDTGRTARSETTPKPTPTTGGTEGRLKINMGSRASYVTKPVSEAELVERDARPKGMDSSGREGLHSAGELV